jgi:GTP-binding protein Era
MVIFTSIGDAHAQGFSSLEEKISEKLLLAQSAPSIIYHSAYSALAEAITSKYSDRHLVDATNTKSSFKGNEASERNAEIVEKIKLSGIPTIVVINKIDLTNQEKLEKIVAEWHERLPEAIIVPASAKEQFNIEAIFSKILENLPEGEPYYPKDTLTDKTLRFFASEIIREKILLNYDKEIPYCCEIEIDSYKEEPTIDRISATIYVSRNSQKGIVIGHKGERLKKVGQQARADIEAFLDKKVFLQLFVKVNDDWRNNDRQLSRFGYNDN